MTSTQIDRLDGLSSSVAIKGPAKVATTANITLSGVQIVDGEMVLPGDRVLVKDQTEPSENGIYVADTGPWRRARDFSSARDVVTGTQVFVWGGTWENRWFACITDNPVAIGTSDIIFVLSDNLAAAQAAAEAAIAAASGQFQFSTIAALQAAVVPSIIQTVPVAGYYSAGDGGGAYYRRISTPVSPKLWQIQIFDGSWWELAVQEASLLHFGVRLGTYGADNTVATANTTRLLAAVDWLLTHTDIRERLLRSPEGTIELMDFELPIDSPYITFLGTTWNNSVWLFKNMTASTIGCRVNSIESSFWFIHMLQYITGAEGDPTIITGRTLLHAQRPAHPELPEAQRQEIDVDMTVIGCKFSRAGIGVNVIGRGARIETCLFSVNTRCINLGWGGPNDYKYDASGAGSYTAGYRAFQIQNNRFHSFSDAAVGNDGTYADKLQGIILTGNYADIGRPLFDGVLIDGEISASVVTQTVTEAVRLRSGSKRSSISGTFSGSVEADRMPNNLIKMFGNIHAISFEGLTLSHSRQHAILHDGSGIATAMDFDGILFDEVCLEVGNFCPICFIGGDHTGAIRNIVLCGDAALTGILRTDTASTAITVENVRRFGTASTTPYYVGAGGRYVDITYSQELRIGSSGNVRIMAGTGSPAGVVPAVPGSIFMRTDGSLTSTAYFKVSASDATGWAYASLTLA